MTGRQRRVLSEFLRRARAAIRERKAHRRSLREAGEVSLPRLLPFKGATILQSLSWQLRCLPERRITPGQAHFLGVIAQHLGIAAPKFPGIVPVQSEASLDYMIGMILGRPAEQEASPGRSCAPPARSSESSLRGGKLTPEQLARARAELRARPRTTRASAAVITPAQLDVMRAAIQYPPPDTPPPTDDELRRLTEEAARR